MTSTPSSTGDRAVALYVHFPFCLSVCPYCDFVVYGGSTARGPASRVAATVDALVTEIGLRGVTGTRLDSVYLGGGTPSLLTPAQLERLLAAADVAFGIAREAEITLEVNPGPADRGDLGGFRAAGVNRLSVGAQSLADNELRAIGRRHSPGDVVETVRLAKAAGFGSVSLDLLYDLPGQTVGSWRTTLDAAMALEPDHVSAYSLALDDPDAEGLAGSDGDHLTLRPGARAWRDRARLRQHEDRAADMYQAADELLSASGLRWYELSNWSRPGHESRHNLAYWTGAAWEAVGPGAHAFDGIRTRRWNGARLDGYLAALAAGRLPPGGAQTVDEATAAADAVILTLRTVAGLPASLARAPAFEPGLDWARSTGLVEGLSDGGLRLTLQGRMLANEVFVRLMPDRQRAAA